MGLCKCPKRQVTNQFCFEHRVNVCEHCMVQSHPKCIVQSYLQWLRDSDYISNCTLCGTTLEQGECVRLVCYHVYHWDCLNARQAALPANTAPHGHTCPMCETEIFPTSNLVSPVADALKALLSGVNWGRNGLGLALLSEDNNTISAKAPMNSLNKVQNAPSLERSTHSIEGSMGTSSKRHESPHSVLLMDAFNLPPEHDMHANSRRPLLPRQQPIGGSDRDENKYKRRTPAEIFSRWSRRFYAPSSRPPWRRTWFYVLSGIAAFLFIIYIMAALGRGGNSDRNFDDNYDNPNQNSHLD